MKIFTDPKLTKIDDWFEVSCHLTDSMNEMIKNQAITLDYAILRWCSDKTLLELIDKARLELEMRKFYWVNNKNYDRTWKI